MFLAPFRQRDMRRATAIFPRQLVAAGPFLSRIEAALPDIADKPALILWGDRSPMPRRFAQLRPFRLRG